MARDGLATDGEPLLLLVVLLTLVFSRATLPPGTAYATDDKRPSGDWIPAPPGAPLPPECALLDDPRVMTELSGPAERHLRLLCEQTRAPAAPPPTTAATGPANAPIGTPAPSGSARNGGPSAQSIADVLVNNRTTDTYPHVTQSGPSATVNGSTVVVAYNDSGAALNDFVGIARSIDNGATFTDLGAPPVPLGNVKSLIGEVMLAADHARQGGTPPQPDGIPARYYLASDATSVSPADRSIVAVYRSNDGQTWDQAGVASPSALSSIGTFLDFPALAVDNGITATGGSVYACWTHSGSSGGIEFSRSTDQGVSFSQLSETFSAHVGNVNRCSIAVDPATGRVYVAWRDSTTATPTIQLRISGDGGTTFGAETTIGEAPPAEGLLTCGAQTVGVFVDADPGGETRAIRSSSFPRLAVNPTNGHVYAVWHRAGLNGGSGADVAFSRSTDGGASWSPVVRANPVSIGQQFWPSVAVNAAGRLKIQFYSTQRSGTDRLLDVYEVSSADDGGSFQAAQRVNDVSFDRPVTNPNFDTNLVDCYMGDHIDLVAPGPGLGSTDFYGVWGDNRLNTPVSLSGPQPDPDVRFERSQGAAAPAADLALNEAGGPATVEVGEAVAYTLTVTNFGPNAADDVEVSIGLAGGVQTVQATAGSGGACSAGAFVSCTLGTVASGANATARVVVVPSKAGALTLTATVSGAVTDANPANESVAVSASVQPCAVCNLTVVSSGDLTTAIPDNGTVESPLVVSQTGPIGDVDVNIRVNHPFDADLDIFLVHPDGTAVELSTDNGDTGDNYGSGATTCAGTFTTFDDSAPSAITVARPPFAGDFRPEAPLSALIGKPRNGTWKLRIADDLAIDAGTLYCWQLVLSKPRPALDLTLTKSHTGTFFVGGNGTYTLTVHNAAGSAPVLGQIQVADPLPSGLTFVSGGGNGWSCLAGPPVTCTNPGPLNGGDSLSFPLTVAVGAGALPGGATSGSVTNSASVSTAGEANGANNAASDPTIISQPPAVCGIRPTVGLQVTRTGAGLLHATLTAGTSLGTPSNALTAVRILSAANAEVNNLNGQSHLRGGQVALPSVQQTSFDVQRLAPGAFTVQIEVTDGCGPWKTLVGGGPGVP